MLSKVRSISFETEQVIAPQRLPRMDIPVFVGFAAAGPIGVPVPVADETDYRRIFGDDLRLVWDRTDHTWRYAYLGPSVRGFFAGGGRQCYVIRVATESACSNRFLVPGLRDAQSQVQAEAQARSEGVWSDRIRVGTSLQAVSLGGGRVDAAEAGRAVIKLDWHRTDQVRPGDLLRLVMGTDRAPFQPDGSVTYFAVDHVDADLAASSLRVSGRPFPFRTPLDAVSGPVRVVSLAEQAEWEAWLQVLDHPDQPPALHLWFGVNAGPAPGTLLRVSAPQQLDLFLMLHGVSQRIGHPNPQAPYALYTVASCSGLRSAGNDDTWNHASFQAERLSFTLWAQLPEGRLVSLKELGFLPRHPRFFGYLPTDRLLLGTPEEQIRPESAPLWEEVDGVRRFPLAAGSPVLPTRETAEGDATVYLPIGMVEAPLPGAFAGARPSQGSEPVRNGLGRMSADLFFPPDLQTLRASDLSEELERRGQDTAWRPLAYAAWQVENATILALPDAVHPPWRELRVLGAPTLSTDSARLTWTDEEPYITYRVQRSADPAFQRVLETIDLQDVQLGPPDGLQPGWYRVCAVYGAEAGPFSNAVHVGEEGAPTLPAPAVLCAPAGEPRITWTAVPGAHRYCAQLSPSPQFDAVITLTPDGETTAPLVDGLGPVSYVRVRAEGRAGARATISPWSVAQVICQQACERDPEPNRFAADTLLVIQAAALRLALARGDLCAVLNLPEACRADEAQARLRLLQACIAFPHRTLDLAAMLPLHTGGIAPKDSTSQANAAFQETDALSFGALFHPWTRGANPHTIVIPPDGPVAGLMAARTLERGAWAAPANTPLPAVAGLAYEMPRQESDRLEALALNVLEPERRGIVIRSAHTLALDRSVRPIGVRRLLILLRRLLYREGMLLAFEPNDMLLRRLAHQRFSAVLLELHQRGALAGATPAESFEVSVHADQGAGSRAERGQLVIDLKIAPARPLEFISVVMRQTIGEAPLITGG